MALLEVRDLSIEFETRKGNLKALERLSFTLNEGETLGIVGESGCGKSITSLALMGLLAPNARVSAGALRFEGKDLLAMNEEARSEIRGAEMSMIFQDPMTSLNPSFTVGFQLEEMLKAHPREEADRSPAGRRKRLVELMEQVGIPDPAQRLTCYPHELSGGMSQRVMIAMAVASRPKLLIADEPTTALDVTIQAQILELLRDLQRRYKMALILITHDLGVVSETAARTMVMYAGQAVEEGPTREVIASPRHPYTAGLLQCLPALHAKEAPKTRLPSIAGMVPDLLARPSGCQFHPRCSRAQEPCWQALPDWRVEGSRGERCHFPLTQAGGGQR
ncbi:MAG: ABC transporter ATP-binding protein [Bdellovibrionales bacterium]|nr:ABC transporter ATP-binding protein [Bdellovibrionales bacterium]